MSPDPPDLDPADEQLMRQLYSALHELDAPPDDTLLRHARDLDIADAELVELRADSAVAPPVGQREHVAGTPRRLDFHCPQLRVLLEVTAQGRRRDIVGQVHSALPVTSVEIRWPTGHHARTVTDNGVFTAPAVPAGPLSVLCHRRGSTPVTTSWVCL